jgi:radical SAM family uncharacterized protein/radical SAM-linked protein
MTVDLAAIVDGLLAQVSKPSRYLGNEVNAVRKDTERAALRFALAFPDVYEVGMSHMGFRILYHILNRRKEVAAERFFCPWPDMEALMRREGLPLFSQESRLPLCAFDVLGFSIPYEMGYSNVLHMLDLGGVALRSRDRAGAFPLVMAGGPCAVNPEPLTPFVDAFLIGDGEEAVEEMVDLLLRAKGGRWHRERLLEGLARIEGVYVPGFFHILYGPDGEVTSRENRLPGYEAVRRRIASGLDPLQYPSKGIVPYTQVIHDRVSLEIARGCTRGCRFCQAGFTYRPVRERSPARILDLADRSLRETGYEELSLLSLSSGDYSTITDLLGGLMARYGPEKVAVSLPSLRIGSLSDEIMAMIKEVRKTGITVAPEAGTERLRRVINKDVTEAEVLETARRVYAQGWLSLKLYFMIGLPTETQEDLEGIVALCERILRENRSGRGRMRLNVSLSTFVPKPHTPFQWARQLSVAETRGRLNWLRRALRRPGIQVKWQEPRLSLLEGAFSRGDRRLGEVLERAHAMGCKFDGWSEQVRLDAWEEAFCGCGFPLEAYATREVRPGSVLPWAHLDMGVCEEYLLEEYRRALAGQRTPDCREGSCQGCAVCGQEGLQLVLRERGAPLPLFPGMKAYQGVYHRAKGRDIHRRFRLGYTKVGAARFLSHLELNSVVVRALRRAGVPLRFSQGFHPMPRIDFGPALPVGVESLTEYLDFETFGEVDASRILGALQGVFPEGIVPMACTEVPLRSPSLFRMRTRVAYDVGIPPGTGPAGEALAARVRAFREAPTFMIRRVRKDGGKAQEIDARPHVEALEMVGPGALSLLVLNAPDGGIRLLELLGAILGVDEPTVRRLRVTKVRVEFLHGLEQLAQDQGRTMGGKE